MREISGMKVSVSCFYTKTVPISGLVYNIATHTCQHKVRWVISTTVVREALLSNPKHL